MGYQIILGRNEEEAKKMAERYGFQYGEAVDSIGRFYYLYTENLEQYNEVAKVIEDGEWDGIYL